MKEMSFSSISHAIQSSWPCGPATKPSTVICICSLSFLTVPPISLRQEVQHDRFQLRRIVGPVAVDLPGKTSEDSVVRFCPLMDRMVRAVELIVTAFMNGDGDLAGRSRRLVD